MCCVCNYLTAFLKIRQEYRASLLEAGGLRGSLAEPVEGKSGQSRVRGATNVLMLRLLVSLPAYSADSLVCVSLDCTGSFAFLASSGGSRLLGLRISAAPVVDPGSRWGRWDEDASGSVIRVRDR